MKKRFYLLGMAAIMMASCTSEEFLGENNSPDLNQPKAIEFSYELPNMTRATNLEGESAAEKLGNVFKVWGTKSITDGNNSTSQLVFGTLKSTETGGTPVDNTPYSVWYVNGSTSASNTKGWEYVGAKGNQIPDENGAILPTDQTIKYWDNATYTFVAYADKNTIDDNYKSITTNLKENSSPEIEDFTFTANAEQMANIYFADKVTETKSNIASQPAPVTFKFRNASAKVRLGIYENIPGFTVKDVTFKNSNNQESKAVAAVDHLNSDSYTVTWGTENNAPATLASETESLTDKNKAISLDFGNFTTGEINSTSSAPTYATDGGNDTDCKWTSVLPIANDKVINGNMSFEIDFTLVADDTGETIDVTGAKVTIPDEYQQWKFNYAYTYILKITEKTLGDNKIYPITFDACVVQPQGTDVTQEGTTTTFEPYSITTYQKNSVSGNNLVYKAGTAIDISVMNNDDTNRAEVELTNLDTYNKDGYFAVYKKTGTTTDGQGNTVWTTFTEGQAMDAIEAAIKTAESNNGGSYSAPQGWTLVSSSSDTDNNKVTVNKTKATLASPEASQYYIVTYSTYTTVSTNNNEKPQEGVLYYTKDSTEETYSKVQGSLSEFAQNASYFTKSIACKVVKVVSSN